MKLGLVPLPLVESTLKQRLIRYDWMVMNETNDFVSIIQYSTMVKYDAFKVNTMTLVSIRKCCGYSLFKSTVT